MTQERSWSLRRYATPVAVCRLAPDADVPQWANAPTPLSAIVRTANELSLVCAADAVPSQERMLGPYVAYEIAGLLDPDLVGVLAELLEPLAEASISVLTVSTFDTDWVLVPERQADAADTAWRRRRHTVLDHIPA
ncbi:ACT domain-containing protein [Tenggerimyces flavus]|uniref:ACT domain-containing protein n=1 Tax=Tenggerimyces flavus TaxID=1708749 RepID=A0ABV7YK30_9ACTN|nr:ACT domain-containing protein [Tenggerimyces flavus]MBM7787430.1 hypothetical protein [Tenggerimyces flavus]